MTKNFAVLHLTNFFRRHGKIHSIAIFKTRVLNLFCFTLSLKKVPTFKLSVTLSNLNRFSKLLHYWKAYKICYNPYDTTHLTLGMLLHYLGKLKIQIFCICSANMKGNANKLHYKKLPVFEIRLLTSLLCTPSNTNVLSTSCIRRWIPCWLLTATAMTSAVTKWWCHKLVAKVIAISVRKKLAILKTENIKINLWMNNKVRGH